MLMLLLLLTACSSSSTDEEPQKLKEKPVLKIYLFAPESPIVTRANTGSVNAADAEKAIHTIDIWVFEHESPNNKVSYIHLDDVSFSGQKEITMEISDEFANLPKKPNVDIYVAVNKESCGLQTGANAIGENTTLAQLKETLIGSSSFGINPLVSVPDMGLPMSGLLEDQVISGIAPVYTAMTKNVKLVRAVSKVRFVLCKSSANPPTITNLSISLKANMIPKEEYLFLNGVYPDEKIRIKTTGTNVYEGAEPTTLVSSVNSSTITINSCDNPASYAYTSETGQAYEKKIDAGLIDPDGDDSLTPDLTQVGLFYFRESDKKLEGTISYTVGVAPNTVNKSVPFEMADAGDFTRNHTWIVYGYFLGSGELILNNVKVKGWITDSENPEVYNW